MEKTLALKTKTQGAIAFCSLMLLGCAFLIAASFLRIPFYPVSFTMHTFALAFLALTQSPRLAASSACCFLVAATVGLPVFCGLANPLWIVGKAGGYLVAFPIAAYIISSCARTLPKMVALMIGQCIIYLLGLLWLIPLVGLKTAFFAGVMIFIPSDILKNLMALSAVSLWEKLRA